MISVKIYGAGSIGNHLSYACRKKRWDVTIYDIDDTALSRMKNEIYPDRYGEWDNKIVLTNKVNNNYYDIVMIGTPPESHIPIAIKELESKNPPKIIMIEKPLCTPDLKGCQKLFYLSKEKNVLVLCGFNHTLTKNTIEADKLIKDGIVGDCKSLHVQWLIHWGEIFNAHPWISGPQDSYLGFTKKGGGAMCEHSHAISIWQHFSNTLGYGRIKEVSAEIKKVQTDGVDYDETTQLLVKTEGGLVGTIIQDVVTKPFIVNVRIQGDKDYIEWKVDGTKSADYLKYSNKLMEYKKTRPDDFTGEINHIEELLKNDDSDSPISLERGIEVMMVIAAAQLSNDTDSKVIIDYNNGYSLDSLKIYRR